MNVQHDPQTIFERIAMVSYEATRGWSEATGEPTHPTWGETPRWRQVSATNGVRSAASGATPEQLHAGWFRDRLARGWQYGPDKNDAAKTDPNLAPFAALTDAQRRKFELFASIARTLYRCGTERWAIKTMTDAAAAQVALVPEEARIADLVAIPPPVQPIDRQPSELITYQLTATLVVAKHEADRDLHIVIADGDTTMIVESPDPGCAQGSTVFDQISQVRKDLESQFPAVAAGGRVDVNMPVVVTGVAFFDHLHGQEGVARNGIELHPLLSFRPV